MIHGVFYPLIQTENHFVERDSSRRTIVRWTVSKIELGARFSGIGLPNPSDIGCQISISLSTQTFQSALFRNPLSWQRSRLNNALASTIFHTIRVSTADTWDVFRFVCLFHTRLAPFPALCKVVVTFLETVLL
ncbi:hypothetical protein TNCV_1809481 [Trichonephila clavipes]|nr:hypothetical protein TNCV_1809481 [Trichonephila clavipes]